jgi:hypothetical protein
LLDEERQLNLKDEAFFKLRGQTGAAVELITISTRKNSTDNLSYTLSIMSERVCRLSLCTIHVNVVFKI